MKPVKCDVCSKASGHDRCSRVVCPMRKPITAQVGSGTPYNVRSNVPEGCVVSGGGYRKIPTNREE